MNNLVSFTPLMSKSVGFDRFNDLFESLLDDRDEGSFTYPPYNIEKCGDDDYRIVMAVAGFGEDDLNITAQDDKLIVTGHIQDKDKENQDYTYLHRGIATRAFERTFRLADHIKIKGADLKDGLLTISLQREIPEDKKPRMIPISGNGDKTIESKKKH